MVSDIDIRPIVADHLRPFRFGEKRRFRLGHFLLTLGLPAAVGVLLSFRHPTIATDYQVNILTVFGIIATVMTAMLPIVQAVVGGTNPPADKYTEAQYKLWKNEVVRLEVLRGLYSAICMSVILLVFSLVPLLCLQIKNLPGWASQTIAATIYFVGAAVAVSFLQVISGVYLVLDSHAKTIDKKLRDLAPPEQPTQ